MFGDVGYKYITSTGSDRIHLCLTCQSKLVALQHAVIEKFLKIKEMTWWAQEDGIV